MLRKRGRPDLGISPTGQELVQDAPFESVRSGKTPHRIIAADCDAHIQPPVTNKPSNPVVAGNVETRSVVKFRIEETHRCPPSRRIAEQKFPDLIELI